MKHLSKKHKEKLRAARLRLKNRQGFLNSPATREKLRLAQLGNKNRLGKKRPHSKETKEKISIAMRGDRNHKWKGGEDRPLIYHIRRTFAYKQWRRAVHERDGRICQKCGKTSSRMEAHHLRSFSALLRQHKIVAVESALTCAALWDVGNGQTLCHWCHKETDNYFRKLS